MDEYLPVTVLGGGAMGTLCTLLLNRQVTVVRWWARQEDRIDEIARLRENRRYLPGRRIPDNVQCEPDPDRAFGDARLLVSAIPCQYIRPVLQCLRAAIPLDAAVVSVAKGIENGTLMRPTQIILDVLGPRPVAVLSGPSIAPEVADGLPATLVAASSEASLALAVQSLFSTPTVRIYTNDDLLGVELAGAMKNVIALAAGMIDGLNMGHNTKAALLTRGLVEITRLGVALGARRETFAGLAGLGDLVTTCFSPIGRNRSAGQCFGQGRSLEEVTSATPSIIEGIPTTKSVLTLAAGANVEMPITQAVHRVIFEGKPPLAAIADLMARQPKAEQ